MGSKEVTILTGRLVRGRISPGDTWGEVDECGKDVRFPAAYDFTGKLNLRAP